LFSRLYSFILQHKRNLHYRNLRWIYRTAATGLLSIMRANMHKTQLICNVTDDQKPQPCCYNKRTGYNI